MSIKDFLDLVINLFQAAVAGCFVYFLFRFYYRGLPVSSSLDMSIIPASVFSSFLFFQFSIWPGLTIMLLVVFSFIHFRTVIKDPADLIFVFWALITGVLIGAGFDLLIVIINLLIMLSGILILKLRQSKPSYLLLINYHLKAEAEIQTVIHKLSGKIKQKHKSDQSCSITLELPADMIDLELIEDINAIAGVDQAIMLQTDSFD